MEELEYYTGNENFAYLSFCKRDFERVSQIIGEAVSCGIRLWADESCSVLNAQSSEKLNSAKVFVAFLSRKAVCSHAFRSTLTAAVEMEKPMVAVYLEKVELTLCQRLQIARSRMINAAEISSPKEIVNLLVSEGVFEGCSDKQALPKEKYILIRSSSGEQINVIGEEFAIGRSETMTDYSVAGNSAISRLHVVLKQTPDGCTVTDQNSSNKTYLNGKELIPMVEYQLHNGDEITLADEKFVFEIHS